MSSTNNKSITEQKLQQAVFTVFAMGGAQTFWLTRMKRLTGRLVQYWLDVEC